MKKLMIAAAIACAATFAQAAAVDWTASAVCDPVASAAAGKNSPANGWLGYMILAADLDAVTTGLDAGKTDALTTKAVGPVKTTSSKGAFSASTASGSVAAGSQDFYLIVLNAGTADKATQYWASSKVTETIDASLDTTVQFGKVTATATAGNWKAIPEPTSGLLMLLGMAGLALRRKQK